MAEHDLTCGCPDCELRLYDDPVEAANWSEEMDRHQRERDAAAAGVTEVDHG